MKVEKWKINDSIGDLNLFIIKIEEKDEESELNAR